METNKNREPLIKNCVVQLPVRHLSDFLRVAYTGYLQLTSKTENLTEEDLQLRASFQVCWTRIFSAAEDVECLLTLTNKGKL